MELNDHPASGVEALIDRLKEQGVKAGQEEASRIIEEAERRADWLLEQAQAEADQRVAEARKEAQQLRESGQSALKIAARDMQLEVKETLVRHFSDQVQRLVKHEMQHASTIRALVLQIAGKARKDSGLDTAGNVRLELPEELIGLEELRENPEAQDQDPLSDLVQSLMRAQLLEGVELTTGKRTGIRIQLEGQHAEIDLSDQAVADLLLRHLQPRFRAILEGVIR